MPTGRAIRFFEQAQFERLLGDDLFQVLSFTAERLNLVAGGGAGGIAGKPALASLQELFGPAIVETLGDALAAAQLGDADLATPRTMRIFSSAE